MAQEKNINLGFEGTTEKEEVQVDAHSLMDNAICYTSDRGHITVSGRETQQKADRGCPLVLKSPSDGAELKLDTGSNATGTKINLRFPSRQSDLG